MTCWSKTSELRQNILLLHTRSGSKHTTSDPELQGSLSSVVRPYFDVAS
jgi:hypothetical protein